MLWPSEWLWWKQDHIWEGDLLENCYVDDGFPMLGVFSCALVGSGRLLQLRLHPVLLVCSAVSRLPKRRDALLEVLVRSLDPCTK